MVIVPPLLQRRSSDEYSAPPWTARDREALARVSFSSPFEVVDRRGTAATLRAIDAAHGGGFYDVPEDATRDLASAEDAFSGDAPVVDVQTHFVDPGRWHGPAAEALAAFLHAADPDRWPGPIDPTLIDGAAWAALVFGASETSVALLTSTPGASDVNVLTNAQIAAARDVVDRYAGTGRLLTHTIVHPNLGPVELDAMHEWAAQLRPAGWKCYTLYGPPTTSSPEGGWFLDDDEVGFPFLERVRALGPRLVATHKGIGGGAPAASPRDVGPAAAAFPDITFVVYHSGYDLDRPVQDQSRGVDRLVESLAHAGIGPDGNVYAELGTTWFLMLRRPLEAAHVLGRLLAALGPERIVWGTDCAWYGSPQPLIDAFRAFTIPAELQQRHGYPALTRAIKERILSANARTLYGVTATTPPDRAWVANGSVELARTIARTQE
jgi:predicted TIM-barrel fold metal-dependent hydrolase